MYLRSLEFLRIPPGSVPRERINEIIQGRRAITADTALRLAAFFGVDAESWLALQSHYDAVQRREALARELAAIPRYEQVAREHAEFV